MEEEGCILLKNFSNPSNIALEKQFAKINFKTIKQFFIKKKTSCKYFSWQMRMRGND